MPEVTKSADLLNVALMIFVNELAKVKGLPWWTYHAPGKIDAMTYVDGFLFILGMAIPLALQERRPHSRNSRTQTLGLFEGEWHPSAHITDSPDTDAQM